MTLTLRNLDGALDPTNTLSPFYPQVIPYRLIRLRAQYPATVNLLTADQATAWYDSKGSLTGYTTMPPGVATTDPSAYITYSAPSNAYNIAGGKTLTFTGFSVAPGATYTAQGSLAGTSAPTITLAWVNVAGSVISSVSTTGFGTQAVTGTAPANAVGAYIQFSMAGTSFQVEQVQIEQNSTASAFVTPGPWYSLFTGYVERWPQSWSSGGNYGTVAVDCVDLFGFLANKPLLDPFAADLMALNPNFLYELNEQSGTTVFQDLTKKRGPAIVAPTALANTLIAGQSLTSGDNAPPGQANPSLPLTGAFLGGQGPVVQTALPLSGNGAPEVGGGALLIPPDPSTGMVGPLPANHSFTRIIAVRATGVPPAQRLAYAWDYYNYNTRDDCSFYVSNANMDLAAGTGQAGSGNAYANYPIPAIANPSTAAMIDTDWHLLGFGMDYTNNLALFFVDDQPRGSFTPVGGAVGNTARASTPAAGGRDCVGAQADGQTVGENWIGDIAFVCEIPAALTQAQWLALNASWRNAWASGSNNGAVETSGNRYARVLAWAGYTGPTRIDTGSSVDYGPATDIQGGSNPTYALQALQNVVATEFGQHYVATDGTIVFQARTERYNPTSVATFGEHASSGEIPYLNAKMDFDPTRVANQIEVDAQYGNAPYYASDSTSENAYGQVGLQWTANSLSPEELQDGAGYLLYQNKQPFQRLEALPVDVGANPGLWGALLPLDLSAAVTVNRRPSNAPADSQVGYLEQVTWTIGNDLSCQWSAQVSNAANHYFGKFDDATYGKFDSTLIFGF